MDRAGSRWPPALDVYAAIRAVGEALRAPARDATWPSALPPRTTALASVLGALIVIAGILLGP